MKISISDVIVTNATSSIRTGRLDIKDFDDP